MPRRLATRTSAAGHLADLGRPAGRALRLRGADGLDGVEHHQRRRDLLDVAEDRAEVGLGRQVELVGERVGPPGPQPHLGGRLLAGDVERAAARLGPARGDLEQQGRLADAGLAGQQHHGPGDDPVAEHPVELADAGQGAGREVGVDPADRHGLGRRGLGLHGRQLGRPGLADAAPGLALPAAALPLDGRPAALRADEPGSCRCLCHGETLGGAADSSAPAAPRPRARGRWPRARRR